MHVLKRLSCFLLLLLPIGGYAQLTDSLKAPPKGVTADQQNPAQTITRVTGVVTDAVSGQPVPFINIEFVNSTHGTTSDIKGHFSLSAPGAFTRVQFSDVGFQTVIKTIKPGKTTQLQVKLSSSQTQLKEVSIVSGKKTKYKNKGNPAVELIRQVINHKAQNRMESADYLQYDEYERTGLSVFDLPKKFINSAFFTKYKFLLDTTQLIDGQLKTTAPVYIDEKLMKNYYRKSPEKQIQVLDAEKQVNIIKFIDTAGVATYINRLYGNDIDIYSNNIFIVTNQFLSPIADHAPDFYKFFILDTIQTATGKLVELDFTPRNKGDLLFEGKLVVTLDGNYAVQACELSINKQINVNFMRSLKVHLDFEQYPGGRYYLVKSDVNADFGILKTKGPGVFGQRTVFYSNYKLNTPLDGAFYNGKSLQISAGYNTKDTSFWFRNRKDTLSHQQADVYNHLNKLADMPSFKKISWFASTFYGGFADDGALQFGPIGNIYAFNNVEGSRFQLGGRTTPLFNNTIYFDAYTAYGLRDGLLKYNGSAYYSFNHKAIYKYPNDYFRVNYQYDLSIPGQVYVVNTPQTPLSSFQSGTSDYYLYSRTARVDYVKEFENHFSFDLALRNWDQQAAGTLAFQLNNTPHAIINNLTTSEVDLAFRYAPHEQIIENTTYRRFTIYSKYPIINLQINHGFKGVLNGSYTYTSISGTLNKRLYMSQLGFGDVTLLGSLLIGKVPFPLLNISPANQSIAYDPDAYNQMYYLEFVSDHYAGINYTQSFNGFFLNKIPLIQHLKWREYLSLKALYGGLRAENNPALSNNLFLLPAAINGANGTYALGNTPYIEAGAGIGNIFKLLRIDMIRRFNYLDHPGVSPYGVKFSLVVDL